EELNDLLQTLHEQGLLQLANNMAASHAQWVPAVSEIVAESADIQQLRDAMPALVEAAGLLQELHRQGLLQLANDVIGTREQWAPAISELIGDSADVERLRKAMPALVE